MKGMTPLVAALAICLGLSFATQAQTTFRIGVTDVQESHKGVAIDTFAREVETRTDGRYRIQTFYGGSLGGERESVEAVQLGTQGLTFTSTGPIPNFVPDAQLLDIPFLFRDKAHARAVLDGAIGQELLRAFEPRGFKALAWGENGVRHMTNNRRAIHTPQDLRGLKMRTMENPVHMTAYQGLGIVTVPMPFPQLRAALQEGRVDGQENPLSVILAAQLDQVQRHLSLTAHVYSPALFLMNKAAFDRLSDSDRQAFLAAAQVAVQSNRARVDADDTLGVAILRGKGMEVVEEIDRAPFQAALTPVYAEFERRFGKERIDRIRQFQ